MSKIGLLLVACGLFFPVLVSAHQPVIVSSGIVEVTNPEISRAYYDFLEGSPKTYRIFSLKEFSLYVNVLVPESSNANARYSANIYRLGVTREFLEKVDGTNTPWTKFFEPFGRDTYLQGPEYKTMLPAGTYDIDVSGNGNRGQYVLAIGEKEQFGVADVWNAIHVVPVLKRTFFKTTPASLALTLFGALYVVFSLLLGVLVAFVYRSVLKKFVKGGRIRAIKNIGKKDRYWRFGIGAALFVFGLFYSWSLLVFAAAGFCFFEAAFSWCGLYAAMGKNTCTV